MNGNKLFAASIAILALALGFFLGTLKGGCCCNGMGMSCCKKGAPCEHSAMNAPCDCTKGLLQVSKAVYEGAQAATDAIRFLRNKA